MPRMVAQSSYQRPAPPSCTATARGLKLPHPCPSPFASPQQPAPYPRQPVAYPQHPPKQLRVLTCGFWADSSPIRFFSTSFTEMQPWYCVAGAGGKRMGPGTPAGLCYVRLNRYKPGGRTTAGLLTPAAAGASACVSLPHLALGHHGAGQDAVVVQGFDGGLHAAAGGDCRPLWVGRRQRRRVSGGPAVNPAAAMNPNGPALL